MFQLFYLGEYLMNSRELIKMLKDDGWEEVRCSGSHHQFQHPTKKGTVTVPAPQKDYPPKTLKCILKAAGLI